MHHPQPSLHFTPKWTWQPNTTSYKEKEGKDFIPLLSLNLIISINLQVLQAPYSSLKEKGFPKHTLYR